MRSEIVLTAIVVLVVAIVSSPSSLFAFESVSIEVYPGELIQQAINAANEGDTIYVRSGIYYETVIVNKTVSLIGEGQETTIVDGMGAEAHIFLINADNVVLSDLTVRNTTSDVPGISGVHIYRAKNVSIMHCKVTSCYNGVQLTDSSQSEIVENQIESNYGYGISLMGNSSFNKISENNIENNAYGIQSSSTNCRDNTLFHNNLENIYRNAQTFGQNIWDNDYPSGGNYWSDYVDKYPGAVELDGSGLWDTPYVIDENNQDRYPLMYPYGIQTYKLTITTTSGGTTTPSPGTHTYINSTIVQVTALPNLGYSFSHWRLEGEDRTVNPITILMAADGTLEAFFIDDTPPEIGEPVQDPLENVEPHQTVTVTVNVTDLGTGVYNVTLWYSIDNGIIWTPQNMTEIFPGTYRTTIPGYENCTWVTYKIVAYDNAGNNATEDNLGYYHKYHVIPELSSAMRLSLLMILSITAITLAKWKTREDRSVNPSHSCFCNVDKERFLDSG